MKSWFPPPPPECLIHVFRPGPVLHPGLTGTVCAVVKKNSPLISIFNTVVMPSHLLGRRMFLSEAKEKSVLL